MNNGNWLRYIFAHPDARDLDLDSPQATRIHARLIREKAFLHQLYRSYYSEFERSHKVAPPGLRVELGAGGGFLGEIIDGLVTMDIRPGSEVDLVASALDMPLRPGRVGALFMLNVLHHLPDPDCFFRELSRILRPAGRAVFIEPFVSPLSRRIYTTLHHEPFDPDAQDWHTDQGGPMSGGNDALPWIIFERDRLRFETTYPELNIVRIKPHTVLTYLLSGGVSMRSLLPGAAFRPIAALEKRLGSLLQWSASMMTVVLEKSSQ